MAKRQRVFQRGKEYEITGAGKRHRRLVFMGVRAWMAGRSF
jgi:hypothetical protein